LFKGLSPHLHQSNQETLPALRFNMESRPLGESSPTRGFSWNTGDRTVAERSQIVKYPLVKDRKLLQALEKQSKRVVFSRGYTLFRQGDPPTGVYILRSGEAWLIVKSNSGRALLSLQVPAGSLLGLPCIIAKQPYMFSAEARPGADVGFVARKDFEAVIQSEVALFPTLLEILAGEVGSLRQVLRNVKPFSAPALMIQ